MGDSSIVIDLLSDTVTRPSKEMRQAMVDAVVGDDVFGEDPTVNELEDRIARMLGKEAALFVPSGTMANQIAVAVHTNPGDEMLVEETSHICTYESGAPARLSGVNVRMIHGRNRGKFTEMQLLELFRRSESIHNASQTLVVLENTCNLGGGTVWTIEEIKKIQKVVQDHNEIEGVKECRMHLDGARLWNAAARLGCSLKDFADYFDSVSICFSKGLGAPCGSCVVGSSSFIKEARRYRRMFGGAMRQSGILAGAVIYAIDNHLGNFEQDNDLARKIASQLATINGINLDPETVESNIVIFTTTNISASEFTERCLSKGVRMLSFGRNMVRAVISREIFNSGNGMNEKDVIEFIVTACK